MNELIPVVRCAECRYRYPKDFAMYCPYRVGPLTPEGFCDRGEMRDDQ